MSRPTSSVPSRKPPWHGRGEGIAGRRDRVVRGEQRGGDRQQGDRRPASRWPAGRRAAPRGAPTCARTVRPRRRGGVGARYGSATAIRRSPARRRHRRRGGCRPPRRSWRAEHRRRATSASTPSSSLGASGSAGGTRSPGGGSSGLAGSPSSGTALDAGPGTAPSRALVYGCCGVVATSSAGPISTIRPRYITAIRSATTRAAARSWVTNRPPCRARGGAGRSG